MIWFLLIAFYTGASALDRFDQGPAKHDSAVFLAAVTVALVLSAGLAYFKHGDE